MTARWRAGLDRAAVVLGLLLFVCAAYPRVHRAATTTFPADLVVDHRSARAFWEGYSPFSAEGAARAELTELGPTGLGHPPTTSFWILPLASLEVTTARQVLAWIDLATVIAGVGLAGMLLGWPRGPTALVMGLVPNAPFFLYLVNLGQVSQLIAFAYLLAWWALRRGRPALAGAALGAACTFKLFPAVLVLWLALTRRWRAVAAAAAVYLFVAVVMTARFGLQSWLVFFAAQREVANAWVANVANQSLHGVVQRLLASPACELPGRVAPEALALSSLISLALLVFAYRRTRGDGSDRGLDLAFAAFAVLSVLTSQWAWPHYDALLVLPAMIVATALPAEERLVRWTGVVVLAGLLLSWGIDVRAPAALQNALWRGDRSAHLALHAVETLSWAPSVLLLGLILRLARPAARHP